jgi:hypothetical protein
MLKPLEVIENSILSKFLPSLPAVIKNQPDNCPKKANHKNQ